MDVIVRAIPSYSEGEFRPVDENILDLNEVPLLSKTDMKVNYQPYPMSSESLKRHWMLQFYYYNKEYNAVIYDDGVIGAFIKPFPMCENSVCQNQNQVQEELIRQIRNNYRHVIIEELPYFDDREIQELQNNQIYAKFKKILNEHGGETGELMLVGSGAMDPVTRELREWGNINLVIPYREPFTDEYANRSTTVQARLIPGVIPLNVYEERLDNVSPQNSVLAPEGLSNIDPGNFDKIRNTKRMGQSAGNRRKKKNQKKVLRCRKSLRKRKTKKI